jgi:hypothetical protein
MRGAEAGWPAAEEDGAAGWCLGSGNHFYQARFAGTVVATDCQHVASVYVEIDAVDRRYGAV